MMNENKILERFYVMSFLLIFLFLLLYWYFDLNILIGGGIGAIYLGVIQFYLKDKVWYFWWTLVPMSPAYVKLIGSFLIFLGILFLLIGLII